jgi:hypothetical protein
VAAVAASTTFTLTPEEFAAGVWRTARPGWVRGELLALPRRLLMIGASAPVVGLVFAWWITVPVMSLIGLSWMATLAIGARNQYQQHFLALGRARPRVCGPMTFAVEEPALRVDRPDGSVWFPWRRLRVQQERGRVVLWTGPEEGLVVPIAAASPTFVTALRQHLSRQGALPDPTAGAPRRLQVRADPDQLVALYGFVASEAGTARPSLIHVPAILVCLLPLVLTVRGGDPLRIGISALPIAWYVALAIWDRMEPWLRPLRVRWFDRTSAFRKRLPQTFGFGPDGLTYTSADAAASMRWSYVDRIVRHDGFVFVFVDGRGAYILPEPDIGDEAAVVAFVADLQRWRGAAPPAERPMPQPIEVVPPDPGNPWASGR